MSRALILLLAAASVVPGAPIEETFYQIIGPDRTTVLCDSRTAGACDPFLAELDLVIAGADSEFSVSPTRLTAETTIVLETADSDSDYFIQLSHFFENEIDLGWFTFEGGTGDFLAWYFASASLDSPGDGRLFRFQLDPGPFPLADTSDIFIPSTFGQPFRLRAHYTARYESGLFSAQGVSIRGGIFQQSTFLGGFDLPFGVQIVPVPEPAGLSLFGFIAILLGRVAMRRYRPMSGG